MLLHFVDFAACYARVTGAHTGRLSVKDIRSAALTGATLDTSTVPDAAFVRIEQTPGGSFTARPVE